MPNHSNSSDEGGQTGSSRHYAVRCPKCGSTAVQSRNFARKAGGALGACLGTWGAAARGARAGALVGLRMVTPISPLSGVAAAVLGAFAGGMAGCIAGAQLGHAIDEVVLDNYRCLSCGHRFSAEPRQP